LSSSVCRLLPRAAADGPTNMAADEVMLEAAAHGVTSLRFYTWSEPTLSLGYFQPHSERLANPKLASLPWVRRASGGAALVHDAELTYALALPAGAPWQRRGESWICRMHEIIGHTLASSGVQTDDGLCHSEKKLGPVLCFLHHTAGDLILNGHKIGGSAQRKQRGAVMQHGGILLAQSPYTPDLPGVRELSGIEIWTDQLVRAIKTEFAIQTGWIVVPAEWQAAEQARIRELADSKYRDEFWNRKR
jgi:lipoyl(octanoyl) transferase